MKKSIQSFIAIVLMAAGIAGCSRTVEDVTKWEAEGNTQKLSKALADPKAEVRLAAVESLGKLKDTAHVDALAACLNDAEESVVLATIASLESIGGDSTATPLIAALKLDSEGARIKAAAALGTLKSSAAVGPLSEALDDGSEAVQCAAAKALAKVGDPDGSPALAAKLANDMVPEKVREACATALAKTGGEAAYDALLNTLTDQNSRVLDAAKGSLIMIGDPIIPSAIEALKHENIQIRKEAIALLRGMSAIPTKGQDLVWYYLAKATIANDAQTDAELVAAVTGNESEVLDPLFDACSHNSTDFRDKAILALEHLGDASLSRAVKMVPTRATNIGNIWYGNRSDWCGAPSAYLDLWGALAALNPTFKFEEQTASALEAKGNSALRVLTSDGFVATRAYVPYIIELLDDETCAATARKALKEAGNRATLPLIAATGCDNDAIVDAAADLIADRGDPRALEPLTQSLQRRIKAGEILSESPSYEALQKIGGLEAEPLIMKIRPNTDRALHLFTEQYHDVRVIGAETSDPYTDNEAPVTIRIGFIQNGRPGSLEITFKKDSNGDWRPSPHLPHTLPTGNTPQIEPIKQTKTSEEETDLFGI